MMDLPKALELAMAGRREFRYTSSRGNAGDFLIAESTRQVLHKMGLKESVKANTILVAGGGNLHPAYNCVARSLSRIPRDEKVIILPSTVVGAFPLLSEFSDLILMCREELTSKLAKLSGIRTLEVHDAALSFNYTDWLDIAGTGKLKAFRTDVESSKKYEITNVNRDISELIGLGKCHLNDSNSVARKFVEELSKYAEVQTDRAHVALVATMLGKRVTMFPNNYHKNLSIFKASLESHGNVTFVP